MRIGGKIVRLEQIDSTNTYLKLNRHRYKSGTVAITNTQTNGHGRHDKTWLSVPGKSLTFSLLLSTHSKSISIPFFHLFPVVAIVQSLLKFKIDAKIKWPNDIEVRGKKIGGILIEIFSHPPKTDVIIGIGLNVLEDASDFTAELKNQAGSIYSLENRTIKKEELFQSLLLELNLIYEQYRDRSQWRALQKLWRDQCAHLNEKITIFQQDKKIKGIFVGLDDNGFAIVETASEQLIIQDYDYVSLRAEHDTDN